jgi:hypothetical protein
MVDSFCGAHRIWNARGHEAAHFACINSVSAAVATHERASKPSLSNPTPNGLAMHL